MESLYKMPLPEDIDKEAVIDTIAPHKDADGLKPCQFREFAHQSRACDTLYTHWNYPFD